MQRPTNSETPEPRVYINALRPPIGTDFFNFKDALVFNDVILGNSKSSIAFLLRVNLGVQAYSYASGANPNEPDFAAKGGMVHVVLVLDGDMQVTSEYATQWDYIDVEITAPNGFRPSLHQPATGSQEGDDWTYDIHYEEVLPTFKNMGNEAFDFHAKFQDTYKRKNVEENGLWNTSMCRIHLQPNPQGAISERTYKIRALSIFRTSAPLNDIARFNFKAHVRPAGVSDNSMFYVVNKPLDVLVGFA
ncbi:hypothetical protein BDN71DRAFT_467456 [Pleurotus eryngii]|uniref:Uncharacterized protein n=1 Tax=Pleurotus eryngii TaxID=5323 RepID=A0A9P6DA65_PLEER|nr:hypothetical protein BDN71DRAFT_467456 [Pleurotus eryngii]